MRLCDIHEPAGNSEAKSLVFPGLGRAGAGDGGREARFSRALRNWGVEVAVLKHPR